MARNPPPHSRNDLLLDLDDEQPIYNTGQRAPVNDEDLLRTYNTSHDDTSRPSISYDDFVGAGGGQHPSTRQLPGGPGAGRSSQMGPYMSGGGQGMYSQSSGLNNYQPYADEMDDFPPEGASTYSNAGGAPRGRPMGGKPQNRNSIMSLGGGLVGRAKNMLGMAPEYTEMDLPLTGRGRAGRAYCRQARKETRHGQVQVRLWKGEGGPFDAGP
jgi:phospholipid-transporting ATPase